MSGRAVRRRLGRALASPNIGTPPVDRWVSRDETNLGRMRRQFIRVQTGSLAEGRYQVRVRVRDLVADAEAEQVVEFARE